MVDPEILESLTDEEQVELLQLLEEEREYSRTHKLFEYSPYSKQREFIEAGGGYTERCFMAGNQLGKSYTGGAEVAFHLTGRYPGTEGYPSDGAWEGGWNGKVFNEPPVFWVGGETNETVTKTTQRILCGRIEENGNPGYGSIPKEDIISWKKSPFYPNLVDHLLIRHHKPNGEENGISICYFKPYSQGRARWQGDTVHGVWFDEEPPAPIYAEGLTRTNKYGQFSILTFTPLMGMSDVVTKFLKNPSKSQKVVNMTIYDADHYTDEEKERIVASYPEHEREARARGIPTMGSGRIFQIPEETVKCQPFACPDHFYVINGCDFGWDHPQAHIQLWWDKDEDIFYVARTWKQSEKKATEAYASTKKWQSNIPVAWPHDGYQHEKGGGEELREKYEEAGFNMLPSHATWPEGGNSVEVGITEMRDLMLEGRFKVFNTCEPFFEEFRLYHRDANGKIVKLVDDILSAVRYAYMMRRYAVQYSEIKNPPVEEEVYVPSSSGW
ncbi:terminase large subunit [Vibrio fluvialis]|nr:terminase large subunit [Vibrio fluvialis]